MKTPRTLLFSVLICLPAVVLVGIGVYFVLKNVPLAVRREPYRIQAEYRDLAEDLVAHPEMATYVGKRQAGWRQRPSRIGGKAWGLSSEHEGEGRKVLVWFRDETGKYLGREVEAVCPFPYAGVFYGGGLAVALVLLGLSAFGVACFLRFMRERDDFLAATAHDLTTPLVGMRRMIGRDDDEARRLNERMLLLVDNIKNFLRLGGRRPSPECTPCDVVALCREAYALFAADYEDAASGPVVFSPDGEEARAVPPVLADATMLLQILWNLFGNDLKYAAPYGKVEVRISADERDVTVAFADEGPGMTARQMRNAFDRYYRAKTVLETGKGGFGIGLCTSREFARAMGGDLTVRANVPRGCVFAVRLPRDGAAGTNGLLRA